MGASAGAQAAQKGIGAILNNSTVAGRRNVSGFHPTALTKDFYSIFIRASSFFIFKLTHLYHELWLRWLSLYLLAGLLWLNWLPVARKEIHSKYLSWPNYLLQFYILDASYLVFHSFIVPLLFTSHVNHHKLAMLLKLKINQFEYRWIVLYIIHSSWSCTYLNNKFWIMIIRICFVINIHDSTLCISIKLSTFSDLGSGLMW